ncbi:GNAT family N-acetyltransferase [Limosilactobacillus mucosae]
MVDDQIEGIFVAKEVQSQGIGKQLLDFVKTRHSHLSLNVY